MDLFRRDAAIRTQAACQLLEADLGLATLQHASSQAGKHVWQDPFAGLLDNGMGADLTKAAVTTAAQSFRCAMHLIPVLRCHRGAF